MNAPQTETSFVPSSSLTRRRFHLSTAAAAASLALPGLAQSPWPNRPIRIVVPYTPGGFTDQMARLVQIGLQQRLGQPVLIDNRPGANSLIGVDAVAKAAPDGSTFGVVIAAYAANTSLYAGKLPYDPRKDLMGVSLMGVSPLLAAVNNDAPFKTGRQLIDYARANPGKISFGSSGNGSAAHLTTELWKALTKTYMVHVPYRGAVPALTDLMGGQIQLFFDAPTGLISQARAGKIRLIGVAGEQRLPAVPDVPTFIEQGFAGFTGSTWAGMLAPAGTPPGVVQRMADEVARIIKSDETRAKLDAMGTFPAGSTPQEFDAFIVAETTKWGQVIKTAGVKAE
ncbi:tripartite tricarboxylate transporter substrate binding protein [Variovorax sp. LT2P21]|uniref:tripartite tricarboxylate transporter substrate binding protein n=1 Tax=Variovorax sp. LT2P21 TaxID=3443731 RepID=UPI003F46F545